MKLIKSVHVTRQGNDEYLIQWTPEFSEAPVTIFAADTMAVLPDTKPVASNALKRVTLSGLAADKRYYFHLRAEDGANITVAERLLPLEGGTNFRDCGGYPTATGHRVKWNRLYRSGYMSKLSPADVKYLGHLGIKVCCDFRGEWEQQNEPSRLPPSTQVLSLTIDPGNLIDYLKLASSATEDVAEMQDTMASLNLSLVENATAQYSAMLSELIGLEEGALLVNCSAGKDRTGFAVALILMTLGVPREAIMHDYLLSSQYFSVQKEMARLLAKYSKKAGRAISEDRLRPMLETRASYLGAALDHIEQEYGTPEHYLRQKFSIEADTLTLLRSRFTE